MSDLGEKREVRCLIQSLLGSRKPIPLTENVWQDRLKILVRF